MSSLPPEHKDIIEETLAAFKAKHPPPEDAPPPVRRTVEHLHERLFEADLSVGRLREALDITDSTFAARFRRHVGYAPAQYIRHLRVETAKRLLCRFDELRIADIAFHIGYTRYRTFARLFKRETGHSPQAYREQVSEAST